MSTVPALLWTAKPLPARKPRPVEPWTLLKNGKRIDAELLGHGEYGWEFLP